MTPIHSFIDEHSFLSNFYPAPLTFDDKRWANSESAYQAMKSLDPAIREELANITHPGKAKRFGKSITMRPDWDAVKLEIMTGIISTKFDQNPELKNLLLNTGFATIEEGNNWNDTFWGISPPGSGIGKNHLGIILMILREKYINELFYGVTKIYTGIGSRETPLDILEIMTEIGTIAGKNKWACRSGGAEGADSAFETGAAQSQGARQIFLPWPQFNNRYSEYTHPQPFAYTIAANIHPQWDHLPSGAKSLVARNMHQVIGPFSNRITEHSKCIICWTPDGCETAEQYSIKTGGTGSAIFLADTLGIPVFNLKNKNRYEDIINFMFTTL